jgi:hypothetical protein
MVEIPLTLALSQMERGQELLLPSPHGEGLGMRGNHISIQQRHIGERFVFSNFAGLSVNQR